MELILPAKQYEPSYLDMVREYRENNIHTYNFAGLDQPGVVERAEDFRHGRNLPEGYVPGTSLWLVDDGEVVGDVNIRHALTDALTRFGGHIGYGVRVSRWNEGLGTAMLAMALAYAGDELGLEKALVTCNDDNIGSARVIEKNGGKLQDKIINVIDGTERLTRRYWIEIER